MNLSADNLTFRQSAAALDTCDAVVAPDSALVHLASARDIPCVGLYGPFPHELRSTSGKFVGISGIASCAPCFYHAGSFADFPATMPCRKAGVCLAMEAIDPVEVVAKTLELARGGRFFLK